MGLLDDAAALEQKRADQAAAELAKKAATKEPWVPGWAPELLNLLEERRIAPVPVYVTRTLSSPTSAYQGPTTGMQVRLMTSAGEFWGMGWVLEGGYTDTEWGWREVSILLREDGSVWTHGNYAPRLSWRWIEIVNTGAWAEKFGPHQRTEGTAQLVTYTGVAQRHWHGFLAVSEHLQTIASYRENLREWVAVPVAADIAAGAESVHGKVQRIPDPADALEQARAAARDAPRWTDTRPEKLRERLKHAKRRDRAALEEELRLLEG